jgi:hypothetical protein
MTVSSQTNLTGIVTIDQWPPMPAPLRRTVAAPELDGCPTIVKFDGAWRIVDKVYAAERK